MSRDVEACWRATEEAVHDTNSYVEWTKDQVGVYRQRAAVGTAEIRTGGGTLVLTPEEAVERVRRGDGLHLKPLLAGLGPELSWKMLRVIDEDGLPQS